MKDDFMTETSLEMFGLEKNLNCKQMILYFVSELFCFCFLFFCLVFFFNDMDRWQDRVK